MKGARANHYAFASLFFTGLALMSAGFLKAQDEKMFWPDKDRINYHFSTPVLLNSPVELGSSGFSNSHELDLMTEFKMGRVFSLGMGLGYGSHNLHTALNIRYDAAVPGEVIELLPDSLNYSHNKLNVKYITLPVELRFRWPTASGRYVRSYVGARLGYGLAAYSRLTTDEARVAYSRLSSVNPWSTSVYIRLGYSMFGVYASYGLSPLFRSGAQVEGADLQPVRMLNLGVSISG
ncbi:outer membrane beta-barrel protein [bacterium]|nr:outer membrane beta-barrel protein [bacterium]